MSRAKTRGQSHQGFTTRRKAQIIIVVVVVVSLFAAWTMLAYSGALDSVFRQKGDKKGAVSIASLNSNNPSKAYIYAGGRHVATEEPIASSTLSPPTNLLATVSSFSAAQIDLSWTASPSQVHHYQVERSANFSASGNGFSFVVDVAGNETSYGDIPQGNGVCAYMYRVRAADATSTNFSAYSNNDLGTTIIFTDASLPSQIIKGVHLTEVRQAVNAVRALANPSTYPPVNWIEPAPQGVPIRAQHMLDLRSNVNPALTALGLPMVSSDSSLAVGNPIRGLHLQDVRDKVK
ncbi:MAG: hypothetical protein AABN34_19180 [Acidobacteriota bacterium]